MSADPKIRIDVRQISWIRPLAADYSSNFNSLAALYAGDPARPDAWRDAIARARQHPRQRSALTSLLREQLMRRGAPSEALAAAALFANDDAVAVVTGQQAGAFGGPLYTILKAVTAIQLARRTSADHGIPVVPVFWVEAEDHDWAEVRSTTVLDGELQPKEITLPDPPGAGELAVGALTLEATGDALDALDGTLAATDFTQWVTTTLREAYASGVGAGTAFARLLDAVLGKYGLVVFESNDPAAKPLVADIFARELQFPGRTSSLASAAGEQLLALGHQPQVTPATDAVALFRMDPKRRLLRRDGTGFVAGEDRFDASTLVAEAVDHPERFSPNVLLRPIVQDAIFPTICYVAGPSELAYLGQLRGAYEHFGVPMPLVHQRGSATLLDAASTRFLAKYDLPFQDLQARDESTLNRLLRSQLPAEVETALSEAAQHLQRAMERVITAVPAVDPTLAGAAKTTLGKMDHDLGALQNKVIQAAKKKDETLRRQFTRAQAQLFPSGQPQERTLGMVFFLNRFGPALADRLIEELPLESGHYLITI
ncbi:MAG TPA: bacillithiol biosynthesis cysteine-adding enzyme BshC [Vicinamibacterales bacterium]|nr:bacillithiol biosynthesis cysteine-adding enzyme BshC [Vicinamibacterales bacterium]